MKFKERNDLSPILLRALTGSNNRYRDELDDWLDDYRINEGEFDYEISVTSLDRPPRERQLVSRHMSEIEDVDPMDMYFSMFGSGMHNVLENTAEEGEEVEVRRGVVIDIGNTKVLIHGQADYYCPMAERIDDYKYTSAWSVLREKTSHTAQLNILKYIWNANDCPVDEIYNQYLFRDWSKQHSNVPGYPEEQALYLKVPSWPREKTLAHITERATIHLQSTELPDDELPKCTDEERWISGSGRRLHYKTKAGEWAKRPHFCRTKEEYQEKKAKHADVETKSEKVEGTPKRCEKYCFGAKFCNQYQKSLKENAR